MSTPTASRLDRTDYAAALIVGALALAVYGRTLAPDLLYGDSAEFQTLAYTLGTTHSTGYPIYLLFARLVGFLPLGSMAWRINLFSALSAAATLSGVYLLARGLTRSRVGALLASVALGQSYTFWSQAIIAEVYVPALVVLVAVLLLSWHWHTAPLERNRSLLVAMLLLGMGLGVHASVGLILPAVAFLVLWTLGSRHASLSDWRRSLLAGLVGLLLGLTTFVVAFLVLDLNDPPSNFMRIGIYPSRSLWGLDSADLDSPLERFYVTVTARQWQDAMFPRPAGEIGAALETYTRRLWSNDFSPAMLLLALLGLPALLLTALPWGVFTLVGLASMLILILNYEPPDQYVFYLPTYVLITLALGAGAGFLLEKFDRALTAAAVKANLSLVPLATLLFASAVIWPHGLERWQALREGTATFVQEDYVYPVEDLDEPRGFASLALRRIPEDAVLIMEWRGLYSTYYLAHVERTRPGVLILEATPHGSDGTLADTLLEEIHAALEAGRPVFVDRPYDNLRRPFSLLPLAGTRWVQVLYP